MPSRNVPALPIPTSIGPPPHSAALGALLQAMRFLRDSVAIRLDAGPLHLATYLVATRPTAADHPGGLIYVSDAAAGQKLQYSDGAAWIAAG